jgi:hypothetical protein
MSNPLVQSKPAQIKTVELRKSAGILDDYAVRKSVLTKEFDTQKSNSVLLLNQTTAQTIENGKPNFKDGVISADNGAYDFTFSFGVPTKVGIETETGQAGGFGMVVVNENTDTDMFGQTAGGLAFGVEVNGDGSENYFGPSIAYGIYGFINAKNYSYVSNPTAGAFGISAQSGTLVDTAMGVTSAVSAQGAGSYIQEGYLYRGEFSSLSGGTMDNTYGLFFPDITQGTISNYAIKTGLGLVQFGDNLILTGLKSGTLVAPPANLVVGEVWKDTTTSATHPILRIKA